MEASRKLLSLIVWCSVILHKNANSQGYYYKPSSMNRYQLINGKFQVLTTTTPPPGLLETIFPWAGNAYDSIRTPEEDAAILNLLSDNDIANPSATPSTSDGYFSWIPMPSMPSMPSMPTSIAGYSLPSFLPGTSREAPVQAAQSMQFSEMLPPNLLPNSNTNNPPQNPMANMNFHENQMLGASSQAQPVIVPGPGLEGQVPVPPIPGQQPPPSQQQYGIPPNQLPQEIRNNLNPTFQFHQKMKDAVPIPSLTGFGQPQPMFPYPYSAGSTPDFLKNGPEKTANFLDVLSKYLTFGKRSDLEAILNQGKVMDARSNVEGEVRADDDVQQYDDGVSNDSGYNFDFEATREAVDWKNDKDFKCPKTGMWRWNGEVCIAVGPVPVWACKPNDLLVSGKIAICRNKIYFSPKVINNHHINMQD